MNILVCIKQVPATSQVAVHPQDGTLLRSTDQNKMNPYDLYALETALRLKAEQGGQVSVLTMGPPQAEQILREAFSMGADEAHLLTDRQFAGADVLATSRALAQGIERIGMPDLILCGKQTTDGDTAQAGPALSAWLGLPLATWVQSLTLGEDGALRAVQDLGNQMVTLALPTPCVVCVDSGHVQPRLPSYLRRKATANRAIHTWSLTDLADAVPEHYGLRGSPTQVERIFPPPAREAGQRWALPPEETADRLYGALVDLRLLSSSDAET